MKIFNANTINFTNTGLFPKNTLFPGMSLYPQSIDPNGTISNGDYAIDPIKCIEHRENGKWYIDVQVSIEYISWIVQDAILVVKTREKGEQAFRVSNPEVGRFISCRAWHIGFDTKLLSVEQSFVLNQNCQNAIATLLLNTIPSESPYTAYSNISTLSVHSVENLSVYDALMTIASHYGGVLDFDMWQIRITSSIGTDKGVTLAYGKNIQESEVYENWDNVVTKLKPIGNEGITLNPVWLTADVQYEKAYAKILQFNTDTIENLQFIAEMYLAQYKFPRVNYKVKAYVYQNVGLGDSVHVLAKQFEIDATVLSYDFNVNIQRIIEVEFGNYRRTVQNAFESIKTETTEKTLQAVDAKGYIRSLIDDEVVTVGVGGHYSNINDALFYLAYKYPRFKQEAYPFTVSSAEILLLSGFEMNEQVIVQRMNLGFITISSEDEEVTINRSALITPLNTSEYPNEYPAFGGDENAVLPVINVLFNMDSSGTGDRRHGIFVSKNSAAQVRSGCGVKNCGGYGIYAEATSQVNAEGSIFNDCEQNGISANNNSRINCQFANVSGAGWTGIVATDSSQINAEGVIASNCAFDGIVAQYTSQISARNSITQNCGRYAYRSLHGSALNAILSNAAGAGVYGFEVQFGSHLIKDTSIGTVSQAVNLLTRHGVIYQ